MVATTGPTSLQTSIDSNALSTTLSYHIYIIFIFLWTNIIDTYSFQLRYPTRWNEFCVLKNIQKKPHNCWFRNSFPICWSCGNLLGIPQTSSLGVKNSRCCTKRCATARAVCARVTFVGPSNWQTWFFRSREHRNGPEQSHVLNCEMYDHYHTY